MIKLSKNAPIGYRRYVSPSLCVSLFVASAHCIGETPARQGAAQMVAPVNRSNYILRPDDVIDIKVFQEDDLQSTLRVARDGTIVFPLIGAVPVGGMTVQAAGEQIRSRLANGYLVNPQVSVMVKEYAKRRFTVLGEVQKPGAYEFPDWGTLQLLEAIGYAGGYTRIAEPAWVTLKRVISGREVVYKLNAKRMARDQKSQVFEVRPGDVITVGERIF